MEIWKAIPDTKGIYEISDKRRVRKGDKFIKLQDNGRYFNMCVNGAKIYRSVDSAYYDTFIYVHKEEVFKTIKAFPEYEMSKGNSVRLRKKMYKSGIKKAGKLLKPHKDWRGVECVFINRRAYPLIHLYNNTFKGKDIPKRVPKVKEERDVSHLPLIVQAKIKELERFKIANSDRYR